MQQSWALRNPAIYLADSDFDTDEERLADDIEEVISNHVASEGETLQPEDIEEINFGRQQLLAEPKPSAPTAVLSSQAAKNRKKKQKRKARKERAAKQPEEPTLSGGTLTELLLDDDDLCEEDDEEDALEDACGSSAET